MTDLKLNYPTINHEAVVLRDFLTNRNHNFEDFLPFPNYQGTESNLKIAARWLDIEESVNSNRINIVECNSANHSLSCLLETLKRNHQSIITEPFTYPAFKAIALNNGFKLLSSDFDGDGLTIEGLEKTYSLTKSKVLYIQPTIHNPTCVVMPLERRKDIAEFARQNDILIIEDDAYRFLHPSPPLRFLDLIPENTFHIFSLSKPFNPFIKTSYLITPNSFKNSIIESVRLNSSGHSSLLSSFAAYILDNDVLNTIVRQKQDLATQLQGKLTPFIKDLPFHTFQTSFHVWIKLSGKIKSDRLAKELLEIGIIIPTGNDFAADNSSEGENFIRVAFGAERNIEKLEKALEKIVNIISNTRIADR